MLNEETVPIHECKETLSVLTPTIFKFYFLFNLNILIEFRFAFEAEWISRLKLSQMRLGRLRITTYL